MSISPSPQFSTRHYSPPQSFAARPAPRQSLITRALLLAALLVTAAGAALTTAPAAQAHDELVSTNPAAGAQLDTAPSELELTFSSALMDLGNQVQVLDADGRNWAEAALVLNRETLVQPLPANMPVGEYSVRWRAVSSDGHPITGSYEFLVGADAVAGSAATALPSEAGKAPEPGSSEVAEDTDTADAANDGGFPAWLVPGILGGVTGLLIYVVYTVVSRRKRSRTE